MFRFFSFLRFALLAGCLLGASGAAVAQAPAHIIDSLRTRLAALPADTSRVQVLDELCWQLSSSDLKQATAYGEQGLALARLLNYRRGQLKCLTDLGNCASYGSDFVAGTRYFLAAERLARQSPVQLDILGFAYNGLANLHISQHEYPEAQQNLEQALALTKQTHSAADRALFGGSLGNVLRLREQYPAAGQQLRKALTLYDSLGNQLGQAFCLGQLAQLSYDQKQWDQTRRYAEKALAISRAIGNDYYLGANLNLLGEVELQAGRLPQAEAAIQQSLSYARRTGNAEVVADNYRTLTEIYAQRGDFRQAYHWQQRFQATHDSLVSTEKNDEIAALRVRSDIEQKEAHIRELTHQSQLQQLRAERQRSQMLALLLGLAAVAIGGIGALLYINQRRQTARVRHEERLRNRIASDLHDDVGTLLTRVTMQAEMLQESQPAATNPALARLLTNSRAAASTMRDVVWSIDAQSDTIGALADRMRDYLDQLNPNFPAELHLDEALPSAQPLAPELRQHLYLIFKEAVTNVLRHAHQVSRLDVRLQRQRNGLLLEIEDDGEHNPAAPVGRSGLGLRSMSQRAAALHGKIETGPLPQRGYRVRLTVPFERVA